MKKIFTFILVIITVLNVTVFAEDSSIDGIRVFIVDITAGDGVVKVKAANTLEEATVITLTANLNGTNIYTGSASVGALSTVSFSFEANDKGVYRISAKNSNGEETLRDWVYMDYNYTDSVERKFEYLIERGIMESTSNEPYELRNTFKMVTSEEPHSSRLFRELSQRTFLNYVLNLVGDYGFTGKYSAEAVTMAEEAGLIDAGSKELYRPLVYEDAMTILVKALGYKTGKEQSEYISVAENLGLADRVSAESGDRIKTYDAVTLLFNAADVFDNLERTKSEYIFMPRFYDSNMDRISHFTEELSGSKVFVRAVVSSEGENTAPALLVACLYDNENRLVDVSKSSVIAGIENVAEIAECTVEVPEFKAPEEYVIRAYLWKDMNSIAPLCDITELSNSK